MKKVLILGATGLIGHQVYFRLNANKNFLVSSFAHHRKISDDTVLLDARDEHFLENVIVETNPDIIVNCMGVLIAEANRDPENAIFLNAYIPHHLKSIANTLDAKLIHISTDCVFSGKKGSYIENDIRDADDIYGRTKAIGEVTESPHVTLRTSVVGPEIKEGEELFHWFMSQEGSIEGFTKSYWSGVTTLELAKAVEWVIEKDIQGLYHITNGIPINKYELLMLFKQYTNKKIEIESVKGKVSDKSFLDTRKEIDYTIPSYEKMISEMILLMKNRRALYEQYTIVD
ncbi:SDR family oxidoreductase [Gammaproteobacteria bacterium]|nr:SDR family oxidoreductase [Gammaproteobacteria bacterium]